MICFTMASTSRGRAGGEPAEVVELPAARSRRQVSLLVEWFGVRPEVEAPAVGLQTEPHRWDADVGPGDHPPVPRRESGIGARSAGPMDRQGTGPRAPRTSCPGRDLRTGSSPAGAGGRRCPLVRDGAGGPRSVGSTGGSSAAARIGECAPHEQRWDDGAEIGERARQSGASNAVDDNDVSRVERDHVMGDDLVLPPPSVTAGDAELDDVTILEPVEMVEPGRGAVGGNGMPTVGEGGGHQATDPRAAIAGHDEHARVRLVEPAQPDRGGDAAAVEVQFGSLAAGQRTMLRGCKLGNGAYSVVRHDAEHTERV